jgi:O-antigen chain-terminating methyltransferase
MKTRLEILDLFGVPTHGGTVAASCQWEVDPEILRCAEGLPIHLSSHVRDSEGRTVLHDGARSQPILLGGSRSPVVLPLTVPVASATYNIDLDAVVEGKFWASSLGFEFPSLLVHRRPDGSLTSEHPSRGRPFRIQAPFGVRRRRFRIPHSLYGVGESERCVEIPWVLSRYRGERAVLDIGTAFAERRYLEAVDALRVPLLSALDLVPATGFRGRAVVGDARFPPFRRGSIDLVLAISVIEHIGRDNRLYLQGGPGPSDPTGDYACIRALAELIPRGGRILVTVPFGRSEDHGWFVQYDLARLKNLVAASGLGVAEVEFFRYRDAWQGPLPPDALSDCGYGRGAVAASGLACLSLVRERGPLVSLRRRLAASRRSVGI